MRHLALFGLGLALIGCDPGGPPPQIIATTYTKPALQRSICQTTPKACAEIKGVTWFIDRGYVFSLDEKDQKHFRDLEYAVEIVDYKSKPVVLDREGMVMTIAPGPNGQDKWFDLAREIGDLAVYCDDLLTVSRPTGTVRRFRAEAGDARWSLTPQRQSHTFECGRDCRAPVHYIQYVPQVNGRAIAFTATEIHQVRRLRVEHGALLVTGFDGVERPVTYK